VAKKTAAPTLDPAKLVLAVNPPNPPDLTRFDGFLDLLCPEREYQKRAIRTAVSYLLGGYADLKQLAAENYAASPYLQQFYPSEADFLNTLHLSDKLYATLDLATGTGKSYVLYGIAQIMFTLGAVDNVLLLCPSLTIKQGLTQKFEALAYATPALYAALPGVAAPNIIDATSTPGPNTICVTNIHQTYAGVKSAIEPVLERTGGERTLVLNDEVHHLLTATGQKELRGAKQWLTFLQGDAAGKDHGFRYIIGVSGTPYGGKDDNIYFSDVIYRYSLVQATAENRIKDIYYRVQGKNDDSEEARWAIMLANHQRNRDNALYQAKDVKPLTIIVTNKVETCKLVHQQLTELLVERGLAKDIDQAEKMAIPVTSHEDHRKYVAQLPYVDDPNNPVQWIVSVSMLTEGWDVKNVFQIVPHESRAFNSKLLIAQVIGRGLRLPAGLNTEDARLIIFNHPSIARNMGELVRISELVAEVSEGTAQKLTPQVVNQPPRAAYHFTLHNLSYDVASSSTALHPPSAPTAPITDLGFTRQPAGDIAVADFAPLLHSGEMLVWGATFIPHRQQGYTIEQAAAAYNDDLRSIIAAAKARDLPTAEIEAYTLERITQLISDNLSDEDRTHDFVSEDNLVRGQRTFSRLRPPAATMETRYALQPLAVVTCSTTELHQKATSVVQFWKNSTLFFDDDGRQLMTDLDSQSAFDYLQGKYDASPRPNLSYVKNFPSPVDVIVSSSDPEFQMIKQLCAGYGVKLPECLKAWVKSADTGFYTIPYTLNGKPREFNPDFVLQLELDGREVILFIEIKSDKDDNEENRAKQRAATRHFAELNRLLEAEAAAEGQPRPHYIFFFLSPTDYGNLFATLQKCSLAQLEQYRGTLAATLAAAPLPPP